MAQFDSPEFWNPKVKGAECLNRQAARSILPIADLRTRMVMAGHSKAEVVSAIKAAFDNKQLPDLENGNIELPPILVFAVEVAKWSDGTAAPMHQE